MKRKIIEINEQKCNGCGLCIPNCPEGALQIIDGKARLISDLFCDGLGVCIGHCPEGAIAVLEREAEPYDERRVMENIARQGENTIIAHLKHLKDHGEEKFLSEALGYLKEKGISVKEKNEKPKPVFQGCPGSREIDRRPQIAGNTDADQGPQESQLRQWPIQLALLNPNAPYFKNSDLVITADCVPFAYAGFHQDILKGKALVMFCPKLDASMENYVEKLAMIFQNQGIKSITLVHMEVPCCFGIKAVTEKALKQAGLTIPMVEKVITIEGELL